MDDLKRRAHELTYRLLEQSWTGAAQVVAPEEVLAELHAAFAVSWAAMLAAFSSGIAHAEPDDPQVPERERRLAQLRQIVLVAPGESAPPNAQAITFVPPEAAPAQGAPRLEAR